VPALVPTEGKPSRSAASDRARSLRAEFFKARCGATPYENDPSSSSAFLEDDEEDDFHRRENGTTRHVVPVSLCATASPPNSLVNFGLLGLGEKESLHLTAYEQLSDEEKLNRRIT